MSNDFYGLEFGELFDYNFTPLTMEDWEVGLEEEIEEIRQNNPKFRLTSTDRDIIRNDLLEMRVQSGELVVYESDYYYSADIKEFLDDAEYNIEEYFYSDYSQKKIQKLIPYCKKRLEDILS